MENNLSPTGSAPGKLRDPHAYRSGAYLQAHIFLGVTVALISTFKWPLRWLLSGTPVLTYALWLGQGIGCRVLPFIPLWTLVVLINMTYYVAATSWLLFGLYLPACYLTIVIASLYQFDFAARVMRRILGPVLQQPRFIKDRIAFLDIPALEIDTEVKGLMVIRGLTFSLLHLNLIAHGVEVGIKLSDDMEIAIHVDEVKVSLFRRIEIGDVYGNLKGGKSEMTLELVADPADDISKPLVAADIPPSIATETKGDFVHAGQVQNVSTIEKLTDGSHTKDVSAEDGLASITKISPDEEENKTQYTNALTHIQETSAISQSKRKVEAMSRDIPDAEQNDSKPSSEHDMRAAICTQLHDIPSVGYPPPNSIKVTTLRNLSPPYMRRFLHRLPFLLRLLLNFLAYFHPVHLQSVTAGLSGKWLRNFLHDMVFKNHAENDAGIRKLKTRIEAWLADANFVLEITSILGLAHVPLSAAFDIDTQIKVEDLMAYRTLPQEVDLKQVVHLAGADASVTIPSFLLPHHEHILPEKPDEQKMAKKKESVADAGIKAINAQKELEQIEKDESNLAISAHARLPAVFDQELLDFVAAVVKASKIIEMEQGNSVDDAVDKAGETLSDSESISISDSGTEVKGKRRIIKDWTRAMGTTINNSARRVAVDAVTNDRWIAKMVGKITRRLENTRGDLGYSGSIPIALAPYRAVAEDATKLLP